ncbi:prostasin-like protein [Aphelenchoides avenae]|nr:prostasin-like protein [Aphelenchus avenae]
MGGHAPAEGNWPFLARISSGCTGSIVGRRYVLTAAHCIDDGDHPMPENINASDFIVYTDAVRIENQIGRKVKNVLPGPQWYKQSPDHKADDVALLELEEPIEFNDYAQPICLPKSFRERPGDSGYFVGWGTRNSTYMGLCS